MLVFEVLGTTLKVIAITQLLWFGLVFIFLAIREWRREL